MADNHSTDQRSRNMSRIRSINTTPEVMLRKFLFSRGLRFRNNDSRYLGKPDIVLPMYRTVIFVNGCFWHRHENCKFSHLPKSNTEYWLPKLENNARRDNNNYRLLEEDGWNVIVVWECELRKDKAEDTFSSIYARIVSHSI